MQRIIYNNFVGARSLRNYYILFYIGRTPDMNGMAELLQFRQGVHNENILQKWKYNS